MYKEYKVYLAGSIEALPDRGLSWREKYKRIIEYMFDDVKCIIPNDFDKKLLPSYEEFLRLKKEDFQAFQKAMREVIHFDLNSVLDSNCLIIKWDGEALCGTFGEAQTAFMNDIPVYLVTSIKQENIPSWFLGCITELFKTDIDLFEFLINTRI